ncbi:hypothetical protein BD626DRAFT_625826 [Schizophyllum amplum]|uniref:Uncharacterized protein n=1 Tax=Schizophyllum amplum TaxID=97359 RepID=A0A550CRD2_9AGAR|nr:hypothetical protein BD626DRAFT_625826 [Auriculariopsis ampla]
MTICESRALPPSWIRWNSQNIPADALNALFYPPERDRALAKYGDGSSQCSYGIISLQNSGLGYGRYTVQKPLLRILSTWRVSDGDSTHKAKRALENDAWKNIDGDGKGRI